jgi:ketosteroid isomerase-like protein
VWDVFTPHLIRGKAERDKFHADDQAQMQARGPLTMTIEDMVVDAWDDTALARFYLNFKYLPPNPAEGRVRITDVFRRVNGRWKIVHHHEGLVPTGIPPITEKKA